MGGGALAVMLVNRRCCRALVAGKVLLFRLAMEANEAAAMVEVFDGPGHWHDAPQARYRRAVILKVHTFPKRDCLQQLSGGAMVSCLPCWKAANQFAQGAVHCPGPQAAVLSGLLPFSRVLACSLQRAEVSASTVFTPMFPASLIISPLRFGGLSRARGARLDSPRMHAGIVIHEARRAP